jgi:hypothetical protein
VDGPAIDCVDCKQAVVAVQRTIVTLDDLELAKEAVNQTLAPVQEIVREVCDPAPTEVGLMFGDSFRV